MEAKQARSARDLRHFVAGSFLRRLPLAAAMAVLAVSACNEGTTAPPPDPNEPALVEILQDGSQILVGNQRSFSAEVRTADGTVLSSAGVVWTSGSSNVVTVDGNGVVRAVGGGQSQVFATAGLALDAITITVPAPAGAVSNPGGWVETPDGVVRVDVPMNAVSAEVEITIVAAHPDSLPASSTALAGTAFEFAPAGLAFATPATLTIRYDPALTNVLEARRLRVHKLTGGAWSPVEGGAVDTASTSVMIPRHTPLVARSSRGLYVLEGGHSDPPRRGDVMESLQGHLLISSGGLFDPNFRHSVVLVGEHNADGALGVVLNRALDVTVQKAVPVLSTLVPPDEALFQGGPVQTSSPVLLAEFTHPDLADVLVFGSVGFLVGAISDIQPGVLRARVFAGYSGWGPGQLEAEMAADSWLIEPARVDDVFTDTPDLLWSRVLERKGPEHRRLSRMPYDPGMN